MFVKINPLLGANSDPRNRTINVMRAIAAVATANAGTTPECYVVRDPSGTLEMTNNMITVISNDEAGGWTMDTSSSYSVPTNNTYNSSCNQPYHLHLYSSTGKGTYPYKAFTYRTNPGYTFGSSFVNYPMSTVYYGVSNTTAWNSTNFGYSSGEGAANTTTMLYDWNNSWSSYSNSYLTGSITGNHYPYPFQYGSGEFYLACTEDYIIGIQSNVYITYCGTRYTQGWEDSYSDNPPVVGMHYTKLNSPQALWGWSRYMTTANTAVQSPGAFYHKIRDNSNYTSYTDQYRHALHPISGTNRYNGSTDATTRYGDRHATRMFTYNTGAPVYYPPVPLFYSAGHLSYLSHINQGNWSSQGAPYAPIYDAELGLLVPPAVPMIYQFYGTFFNGGGRLKGIYKSLSGANAFIGQYASQDQDFNVPNDNGGTDQYRIVSASVSTSGTASYLDTFLIRKA